MAFPYKSQIQQLGVEVQGAAGTAETIVAADFGLRILVGNMAAYETETEVMDYARSSFTNAEDIAGAKLVRFAARVPLAPPDSVGVSEFYDSTLAAGFANGDNLNKVAVGAITSGPVEIGETFSGGTSSATGVVRRRALTGDAYVWYTSTGGTVQDAEVLTFSGGGSCTTTDDPVSSGFWQMLSSTGGSPLTVQGEEDGVTYKARDCRAMFAVEGEASKPAYVNLEYMGPRVSIAGAAMTSSPVQDSLKAPICQNSKLLIGSWSPVFTSYGWDLQNNVVMRANGNAPGDTGYEGALITGRDPVFRVTCEFPDPSDFDIYAAMDASTVYNIRQFIGSETGRHTFFEGTGHIRTVSKSDIDGRVGVELEFKLVSDTANGELYMSMASA